MNYSICLDQFSTNFNVNNLSSNGFSIYTNLDNFANPIAQNIPYQDLFSPPIGNCPYIANLPQGATQLVVIDACTTIPTNIASIFSTGSTGASSLTTCCYAVINVPTQPASFCTTCSLDFDIFSASNVGQIVAGNLISSCGTVTDYTIGWYLNGNYSSPAFISGYGTAFTPYNASHPLTGNSAIPATAGNWEGIIHDIAINGVTYSSVSGSANGIPIPFDSCFDTVVVSPLTCNNGPYSGSSSYSHQFSFNGLSVGASASPVSFTYNLSPTTKYFALAFQALAVWDEIEVKWNSGNPSATSNPSLYSQPIYLEKLRVGSDAGTLLQSNNLWPATYANSTTITPTISNINSIWPKTSTEYNWWQKTLTLTNLQTSSNPFAPDYLTITITPNPSNPNTQWNAGFQCLDDFDCADCLFNNWPNSLQKIKQINLKKQYGCDAQRIELLISGCFSLSDWMGYNPNQNSGQSPNQFGINQPNLNLIGSTSNTSIFSTLLAPNYPPGGWIPLKGTTTCNINNYNTYITCGPSSTGTITYSSTANQLQITFNTLSDYLYIKNDLLDVAMAMGLNNATYPIPCNPNLTAGVNPYYAYFQLKYPVQAPTSQCGDATTLGGGQVFNSNDYLNTVYTENPSSNFWSITIPRTQLVNCNTSTYPCSNCTVKVNQLVGNYNAQFNVPQNSNSYTTYTGAKYTNPFTAYAISVSVGASASGSACFPSTNRANGYYWYGANTIPFISSSTSTTGWVNLPSLGASVPCNTGSYIKGGGNADGGVQFYSVTNWYTVRFPNLTGSFNYSLSTNDFEIYSSTGFGITGSLNQAQNVFPAPCPDISQSRIYSYIGGVATVYTASYFANGTAPILIIDP